MRRKGGYLLGFQREEINDKKMKFIILILVLILATQSISLKHDGDCEVFEGSTTDWNQYGTYAIFVDIDYSDLGLNAPPTRINTYVTCTSQCFTLMALDDIYNLSETGFRVYGVSKFWREYSVEHAQQNNFVFHYNFYGCR